MQLTGTESLMHGGGMAQHGHQDHADMARLMEQIYKCQVAGGEEALWTSLIGAHVTRALALIRSGPVGETGKDTGSVGRKLKISILSPVK